MSVNINVLVEGSLPNCTIITVNNGIEAAAPPPNQIQIGIFYIYVFLVAAWTKPLFLSALAPLPKFINFNAM